MTKKRLNIESIAEILIAEIDEFKKESKSLRAVIKNINDVKVNINEESINKLNQIEQESIKKHSELASLIRSEFKDFQILIMEKKKYIPRYMFALLAIAYGISFFLATFLYLSK